MHLRILSQKTNIVMEEKSIFPRDIETNLLKWMERRGGWAFLRASVHLYQG